MPVARHHPSSSCFPHQTPPSPPTGRLPRHRLLRFLPRLDNSLGRPSTHSLCRRPGLEHDPYRPSRHRRALQQRRYPSPCHPRNLLAHLDLAMAGQDCLYGILLPSGQTRPSPALPLVDGTCLHRGGLLRDGRADDR